MSLRQYIPENKLGCPPYDSPPTLPKFSSKFFVAVDLLPLRLSQPGSRLGENVVVDEGRVGEFEETLSGLLVFGPWSAFETSRSLSSV